MRNYFFETFKTKAEAQRFKKEKGKSATLFDLSKERSKFEATGATQCLALYSPIKEGHNWCVEYFMNF